MTAPEPPNRSLVEAAAAGYGSATVVTGQLLGRWICELAVLIRDEGTDAADLRVGRWELLDGAAAERLTQIGYDLLVRLDGIGVLVKGRTQRLVPLVRDHRGHAITPATATRTAPGVPAGMCTCGRPETLGTVHRIGSPCYVPVPDEVPPPDSTGVAP